MRNGASMMAIIAASRNTGAAASGYEPVSPGGNWNAETGNTSGWTTSSGTLAATSSEAHTGTYSFSATSGTVAYQDAAIPAAILSAVAGGDVFVKVEHWRRHNTLNGQSICHVWPDFYDGVPGGGGSLISSGEQSDKARANSTYNTWMQFGNGQIPVPTNATHIRVYIDVSGGSTFYIDDIDIVFEGLERKFQSITNADYETGTTAGWTNISAVGSTAITGKEGTYYGEKSWFSAATVNYYQDIEFNTTDGMSTSIDDGDVTLTIDALVQNEGNSTSATQFRIQFYDGQPGAGGSTIGSVIEDHQGSNGTVDFQNFVRRHSLVHAVPANARWVRMYLYGRAGGGATNYARFDDVHLALFRNFALAPTGGILVDLTASPTQADLDITVADGQMLEVFYTGIQCSSSTLQARLSTDGSTFISSAAYYTNTAGGLTVSDDTSLEPLAKVTGSQVLYGYASFTGFESGIETMYEGTMMHTTSGGTISQTHGHTNGTTAQVLKVRIATLTSLAAAGSIRYKIYDLASTAITNSLDFTTDTSGTDGITFVGKHRLYNMSDDVRDGRAMYRLRRNEVIQTPGYSDGYYNAATGALLYTAGQINSSLDNTTGKSLHVGFIDGLRTNRQAWNMPQEGGYGHCFGISNIDGTTEWIDGYYPHEWDDATSHINGLHRAFGVAFGQQDIETQTTAGSQTEMIFTVDGYDSAAFVFDYGAGATSGFATTDAVHCQVSVDGGVTYKNTDYITGQLLSGTTSGQASGQVIPAATTAVLGCAFVRGIGRDQMFTVRGIGGNTTAIRASSSAYYGTFQKVTHIKLLSPNGYAFNNGWTISCIKNVHEGTPPDVSTTTDIANHKVKYTVPAPLVWFSPRAVTTSGSNITGYTNQGTGGASYDASVGGSNHATLGVADSGWGNRDVSVLATRNDVYYTLTAASVKTVIAIATYGDGTTGTFVSYDGLVSGGGNHEVVGNSGTAALFSGLPNNAILNGTAVGNAPTVLPLSKKTIGLVSSTSGNVTHLYVDQFSVTGREWYGKVGDILMFQEELTAGQITEVCDALDAYYA